MANVGVPLVLKLIVDSLTPGSQGQMLVLPLALLVAYGVLRLSTKDSLERRDFTTTNCIGSRGFVHCSTF